MAKVTFSTDIQSISGKLCSQEGVTYSVNQQTGKTYRSDRHGYSDLKPRFSRLFVPSSKRKSQFPSALWKQNRPSDKSAKGTEAYLAVMKAYKAQHKIGNLYSFMRSLVTDDLKVVLAGNDLTGGVLALGDGQKPGGEQET